MTSMTVSNSDMLALARKLPIPVPWDRDAFIENVARERGRPIRLIASDTSAFIESPCGLWLARDDDDLIFHETGTSDYHIDQIVCHEIGHMLLGHGRERTADQAPNLELCRQMLPDIDPATICSVLGRKDFVADQERNAEMFASMVMLAAAEAGAQRSMMSSVFFRR
jgi:hypothetical protein